MKRRSCTSSLVLTLFALLPVLACHSPAADEPSTAPATQARAAPDPVAKPVEYSGIHLLTADESLFFPDYSCEPTASKPGMWLSIDADYRNQLEAFKDGPTTRVDVRLRGLLSSKGRYGNNGASAHRLRVIEVLEMRAADVCD